MQLTVSYGAALSIGIWSSGAYILATNFDLSNYSWLFFREVDTSLKNKVGSNYGTYSLTNLFIYQARGDL